MIKQATKSLNAVPVVSLIFISIFVSYLFSYGWLLKTHSSRDSIVILGAKDQTLRIGVESWRFQTSLFTPYNVDNSQAPPFYKNASLLLISCFGLFFIGRMLEGLYGSTKVFIMLCACAYAASILSFWIVPFAISTPFAYLFVMVGIVIANYFLDLRLKLMSMIVALVVLYITCSFCFDLPDRYCNLTAVLFGVIAGLFTPAKDEALSSNKFAAYIQTGFASVCLAVLLISLLASVCNVLDVI